MKEHKHKFKPISKRFEDLGSYKCKKCGLEFKIEISKTEEALVS